MPLGAGNVGHHLATRRTFTPDIPGRLTPDEGSDHSRSSSITDSGKANSASELNNYSWPWGVASIAVLAISVEYYFLALFLGCVASYLVYAVRSQASRENTLNQVRQCRLGDARPVVDFSLDDGRSE